MLIVETTEFRDCRLGCKDDVYSQDKKFEMCGIGGDGEGKRVGSGEEGLRGEREMDREG